MKTIIEILIIVITLFIGWKKRSYWEAYLIIFSAPFFCLAMSSLLGVSPWFAFVVLIIIAIVLRKIKK